MSTAAREQLQSIHAMLAAGHRSVRLERHSLLLFGGVGGAIAAFTEQVITAERFPDLGLRALALLVWLAAWLGALCVIDLRWTQRARARRHEVMPFAQAQVTRAWWVLLGMGVLGSCAMFFYGGGGMVYGLWIVLLGLGMFLFGLFSKPLVEGLGLAMMLIGVAALAAGLRYDVTHGLAASCFAVGLPLAGWLAVRVGDAAWPRRVLATVLWTVLVAAPPMLAVRAAPTRPPADATPLAIGSPQLDRGERIVHVPAGAQVRLKLDLDSTILGVAAEAALPMTLQVPTELALSDGAPDGRYRVAGGPWHDVGEGVMDLRIDRVAVRLEAGEPVVRLHARLAYRHDDGSPR